MSDAKKVLLSDEAFEFAKLAQYIKNHNPTNETSAHNMMAELILGIKKPSQIMQAYFIGSKRADDLINFIRNIEDDFLDDELKKNSIDAIRSIQKIFSPDRINYNWAHLLREQLKQEHIVAIKYLSRTIRAHRPLKLIDGGQAGELIKSLDLAKQELFKAKDLPVWAMKVIVEGIDALVFRINNLHIFGHDETISALVDLHIVTNQVADAVEKETGKKINLTPIIVTIMLIKDVFTAPAEISQAALTYSSFKQGVVVEASLPRSEQQKLLTGPAAQTIKAEKIKTPRKIPGKIRASAVKAKPDDPK